MGKEAKIGLAVILILLITFGVVLTRRILLARQEPPAAADDDRDRAHMPPNDERPRGPREPAREIGRPTMLTAKIPSSRTVKRSPVDVDPAGDEQSTKHGGYADAARSAVPSLMPNPRTVATDPDDRYGRAGSASPARSRDPAQDSAAEGSNRAYDPFQGRRSHPGGTAAAEDDPPVNSFRVVDSVGRRASSAGGGYSAEGPSGGYGHGPGQSPGAGYGEGSRYSAGRDDEMGRSHAGGDGRYGTGASPGGPQFGTAERRGPYAGPGGVSSYDRDGGPARWAGAATVSRLAGKDGRRDDGTYEIQPNDTYWTISEKVYGTGAYFRALAEHNRKKVAQEDRLTVGEVVLTPDVAQLEKAHPDLCPKPNHRDVPKRPAGMVTATGRYAAGRTYVVQEGDNLYDIARNELGKAARWVEIYELNRDQLGTDYNYLPRGLQLVLPGNEPGGSVTRRPGPESLQR